MQVSVSVTQIASVCNQTCHSSPGMSVRQTKKLIVVFIIRFEMFQPKSSMYCTLVCSIHPNTAVLINTHPHTHTHTHRSTSEQANTLNITSFHMYLVHNLFITLTSLSYNIIQTHLHCWEKQSRGTHKARRAQQQ